MIRNCEIRDAERISQIYNYYITETIITFDEQLVSAEEMAERIEETTPKYPWLVCEEGSVVIGYALASPWKSRCAYQHSVESAIYLDHTLKGQGFGTELYKSLIDRLREMPVHSVIGGIALPNEGSIALHENLGFEKIGHFKEVGRKFDRWIDVGYWELILNGSD